jgi:hypothetical protein
MRVRVLAPGLALAGAFLASGCGSDGTATVTVTTGSRGTVAADPTTPGPRATTTTSPTPGARTATTTVVRTTTRSTTATRTVERTVSAPATRSTPTTPAPVADPDPVGGTVPSSGRVRGRGYSVTVPPGWNDGRRRFEGDRDAFDLNLVKRPGADLTSSIFTDRSAAPRPPGTPEPTIENLADDVRQDILDRAPTARVVRGPDLRVDGETAISFVVSRTLRGTIRLRQRQVAMLRGPALVIARLTSPIADVADDRRIFARFLASWRWD